MGIRDLDNQPDHVDLQTNVPPSAVSNPLDRNTADLPCSTISGQVHSTLAASTDIDAPVASSDAINQATEDIRTFLATSINPLLKALKKEMALLAKRANEIIDAGEEISTAFYTEYEHAGINVLRNILDIMDNKINDPSLNIVYKGFLRMLRHRLGSTAMIASAASLDLTDAASKKTRFTDPYETLSYFDLTEEELDLNEWDSYSLANSAIREFQQQFNKEPSKIIVSMDWKEASLSPLVRVHPKIFDEVLRELLVNAKRSLPEEGGEITTSIREVNGNVVFAVRDTGRGMSPETLPRIFEAGFTTRADVGGTGNGLALVKEYIQKIGGTIKVESIEGEGTTFSISLPLANNPS